MLAGDVGYKQVDPNMTFAEASLLNFMEHNRILKGLEKINSVIDWSQVEEILLSNYTIGTSREGAEAYSTLMLLKGLLLQKWYRIDSDPELGNQINDQISFKMCIGLSFDQHSPDHSTFSHFRRRLSKKAMKGTTAQFFSNSPRMDLSSTRVLPWTVRLVEFASDPISSEEIRKQRELRDSTDG